MCPGDGQGSAEATRVVIADRAALTKKVPAAVCVVVEERTGSDVGGADGGVANVVDGAAFPIAETTADGGIAIEVGLVDAQVPPLALSMAPPRP